MSVQLPYLPSYIAEINAIKEVTWEMHKVTFLSGLLFTLKPQYGKIE